MLQLQPQQPQQPHSRSSSRSGRAAWRKQEAGRLRTRESESWGSAGSAGPVAAQLLRERNSGSGGPRRVGRGGAMAAEAAKAAPPPLPSLPLPLAVVFDYDYSLINVNSDTWVFQQLAPAVHSHIVKQSAARKGEWTRIVDEALVLAQGEHGVSKDALLHTLSEVPVLEGMTEALREAHGAGAEVHIVSDASQAFIEAFLRRRDLLGLVSSIRTNLSWTDAAGHLRVSAYQAERGGPHGCPLCPVNLCKGAVLARELRLGGVDPRRVLYVGDGGGDFCPVRTLRAGDVALVRKDASVESALGLAKRIEAMKETYPVRAQVLHWVNGEQVLRAVRDAIRDARRVVR